MPFVQLGVRLDDLWVLQESVAEVVHDGGNGEDATQTFIKSWFCHDFVLPGVCLLDRYSSNRSASREPTISGIQALRNLFSQLMDPLEGYTRKVTSLGSDPLIPLRSSQNGRLNVYERRCMSMFLAGEVSPSSHLYVSILYFLQKVNISIDFVKLFPLFVLIDSARALLCTGT